MGLYFFTKSENYFCFFQKTFSRKLCKNCAVFKISYHLPFLKMLLYQAFRASQHLKF
nr:MAG TPA: hypothetical protein [Caudoviricetes sp.]